MVRKVSGVYIRFTKDQVHEWIKSKKAQFVFHYNCYRWRVAVLRHRHTVDLVSFNFVKIGPAISRKMFHMKVVYRIANQSLICIPCEEIITEMAEQSLHDKLTAAQFF